MRWSALSSLVVVALLIPSTVRAESISLGQMSPQGSAGGCNDCTVFQLQTTIASPSYVVPAGDWTIISFSMMGGPTAATGVRLRIMRPEGALYRIAAESPLESLPPGGPRTFNTSIPVTGGDRLGLRTGDPLGDADITHESALVDDIVGGAPGADPLLGQTIGPGGDVTLGTTGGQRLNLAASLTRPDPATNQKTATKKKKCKRKKGAAAAKKKRCKRKRRAKK